MKWNLDLKFPALKFKNDWYYLLSGRGYTDASQYPNGFYVEIDFLCEVGKSVVIYKGTLADYMLNIDSLDYIYLFYVRRTGFKEWEGAKYEPKRLQVSTASQTQMQDINLNPDMYLLPGNLVCFKASEIKNIHVSYIAFP